MKLPTNELAAISWLRTVPGIPSQRVSTKLPGDNSLIAASGFVTVEGVVGGTPDMYLPRNEPVVEIRTWACHLDGDRQDPPWWKANQLMEVLKQHCRNHRAFRGVVPTRSGYYNVSVPSAYFLTEPKKMDADDARFAVYSADVQIHWTRRPD